MLINGSEYNIDYWAPPVGLFGVTVYQAYLSAVDEFRNAIIQAMIMGMPNAVEEQASFCWRVKKQFDTADPAPAAPVAPMGAPVVDPAPPPLAPLPPYIRPGDNPAASICATLLA